jgi:hypothetical protein
VQRHHRSTNSVVLNGIPDLQHVSSSPVSAHCLQLFLQLAKHPVLPHAPDFLLLCIQTTRAQLWRHGTLCTANGASNAALPDTDTSELSSNPCVSTSVQRGQQCLAGAAPEPRRKQALAHRAHARRRQRVVRRGAWPPAIRSAFHGPSNASLE